VIQPTAVLNDRFQLPEDSQPTEEKGHEVTLLPAPAGLGGENRQMPRQGSNEVVTGQVSPEDALLVLRLSL